MFNFFRKQPQKEAEPVFKFPLGAKPNEPDVRDIPFSAVHPLPALGVPEEEYMTDVTMIGELYQILGTCVGHAYVFAKMFLDYLETGKVTKYLIRFLYALSRRYSRFENTDDSANQGIYPRVAAKILATVGVPPTSSLDDETLPHSKYVNDFVDTAEMRTEANKARIGGFAFPSLTVEELKHAVKVAKVVPVTVKIDWSKFELNGTLHTPSKVDGTHEVVIIGWDKVGGGRFVLKNWWPGFEKLYVHFSEVSQVICDAITFIDIPNDLIQRAKTTQYIFLSDLKLGMTSEAVMALQKRLRAYGLLEIDNETKYFGTKTQAALIEYQVIKNINPTGYFGPLTRMTMNNDMGGLQKSKIDLWCAAAERMEGANPAYNNPGNIRNGAYTKSMGSTGVSRNGFAIFPTYALGYMALRNLFVRACTGLSERYPKDLTLYEFYEGKTVNGVDYGGYAPASDNNQPRHYAEVMAKAMGVDPSIQIKNLV